MKSRIVFLMAMLFPSVAILTLEAGEFTKTHFSGYVEDGGKIEVAILWKWVGDDTTGVRFEVYSDFGTNGNMALLEVVSTDKRHVYRDPRRADAMVSVMYRVYNMSILADRLPVTMTFLLQEQGGRTAKMFDGLLMAPPKVTTLMGADEIDWRWSVDSPPADVFYRVIGYQEGKGQILASEYLNVNSFIWNREEWEKHTGEDWSNWFDQVALFTGDVRAIVIREEFQSVSVSQVLCFDSHSTVDGNPSVMPLKYSLSNNYPNPFNTTTKIEYTIPVSNQVNIDVFNSMGQKVKTLVNLYLSPGTYQVNWDGRDEAGNAVPSGVYYCKMISSYYNTTHKMLLLK